MHVRASSGFETPAGFGKGLMAGFSRLLWPVKYEKSVVSIESHPGCHSTLGG